MLDFTLCRDLQPERTDCYLRRKPSLPDPKRCRPYDNCLLWKLTEHSLTFDDMGRGPGRAGAAHRVMMIVRAALAPRSDQTETIAPRWIAKAHGPSVTLVAETEELGSRSTSMVRRSPRFLARATGSQDATGYIVTNYLPPEFHACRGDRCCDRVKRLPQSVSGPAKNGERPRKS